MKAFLPLLCIVLFVAFTRVSAVEDDEEALSEYLSTLEDEDIKGDLQSTERSPRFLGALFRLLRLVPRLRRPPVRRPSGGRGCGRGRGPRPRCPTIRFPCSQMPIVCANMRNAIRLGKPTVLQRTTSRSQIRQNRRASGCRSLGPRTGYNCDEYPFASSFQGGRGAVVRLVPSRENSIQGAILGAFYRQNNIGHRGCFRVSV